MDVVSTNQSNGVGIFGCVNNFNYQHLRSSQVNALKDLAKRMDRTIQCNLDRLKNGMGMDDAILDFNNMFGILAARGAGKTTVMNSLYQACKDIQGFLVLKPIDCTTLPNDINPGAAILCRLREVIDGYVLLSKDKSQLIVGELLDEIEKNAEAYARSSPVFQQLCRDLADSPKEFGVLQNNGLKTRLNLSTNLRCLLEKLSQVHGFSKAQDPSQSSPIQGVIVFLDDFDLVTKEDSPQWQKTLLDELHQERLFFVITADLFHLQRLSYGGETGHDDLTGREMIYKMLPTANCTRLPGWDIESRRQFGKDQEGQNMTLESLIKQLPAPFTAVQSLLLHLLPRRPRGLNNLYNSLISEKTLYSCSPSNKESEQPITVSPKQLKSFFEFFAESRQEYLLAHLLRTRDPYSWIQHLKFEKESISIEDWRKVVAVAVQRAKPQDQSPLRAIPCLVPAQGGNHQIKKEDQTTFSAANEWSGLVHDPNWGAPLRHDELELKPLREADEEYRPLWTELLIQLGFQKVTNVDESTILKNRVSFIERWNPVANRVKHAIFELKEPNTTFHNFFDELYLPPLGGFFWIEMDEGLNEKSSQNQKGLFNISVHIGFPQLLNALRGDRNPLMTRRISRLLVNPSTVRGEAIEVGTLDALSVIPSSIWAIILLVEGLDRCPWRAFSRPLRWLLITHIGLATAFVRSAYVYGLVEGGILTLDEDSSQMKFYNILKNNDPGFLFNSGKYHGGGDPQTKDEAEIYQDLSLLFKEPLDEALAGKDDPLTVATRAFLNSQVYQQVAKQIIEITDKMIHSAPNA